MATRKGDRKRQYFTALVALTAATTTSSAQIIQHRVKHPLRQILYQHVIAQTKRAPVMPFFDVGNLPTATQNTNSAIHWQDLDGSWHLHGNAALVSPETVLNKRNHKVASKTRRRRTISGSDSPSSNFSGTLFIREKNKASEGVDSLPSQDEDFKNSTESWNISTEIELTSFNTTHLNGTSNATKDSVEFSTSANFDNDTGTSFQPMRIRAILSENLWLSIEETYILFQDILQPAILAWSAALRVDPVQGNLTVNADQLHDGETCGPGKNSGLPSVKVPHHHLDEGIPDSDFIIYLSLAFLQGNETNATDNFQVDSPTINSNTSFANSSKENTTLYPKVNQSNLTDAVLGGNSTLTKPTCTGDYLAAATYCSTDQYDRPTAGMMHICVDEGMFTGNFSRSITTIMHEIGHVLGFNPQSMAHFRTQDGEPLTKRDTTGDVLDVVVECPGVNPENKTIQLPSPDILTFRTVRNGVRVAEVVTPTVRQVVRNHFDCQDLRGAELESQLHDVGGMCLGDHWERRLFREDLMNPIVDEVPFTLRISPLTLALFADSGWYQVDLSRSAFPAGWGRGTGCRFVDDTCIDKDGSISDSNIGLFCNNTSVARGSILEIQGCSPDMTRKATCNIAMYDSELPSPYQYFGLTAGPRVGGNEAFLDYCPVYSGFSNGECMSNESSELQVSPFEEFGYKNSRCLLGSVRGILTALCLQIACVIDDQTLRVRVDGTWRLCEKAGQELIVGSDITAVVTCPDPVRTCPTFYCSRDCLGTDGICDFQTGDCLCHEDILNPRAQNTAGLVSCQGNNATNANSIVTDSTHITIEEQALLAETQFSDYYVTDTSNLRNDRPSILGKFGIILVSLGSFVLIMFLALGAWRYILFIDLDAFAFLSKLRRLSFDPSIGPDVPQEIEVHHRNKVKFVASMLLNLRLQHPQLPGPDGFISELVIMSETGGSFTERSAPLSSPSVSTDSENDTFDTSLNIQPGNLVKLKEEAQTQLNMIRRRFRADDV